MSKRKINAGSTSVRLPISVKDTTSGSGAGLTGLLYNTASLFAEWRREGDAAATAMTLVSGSLSGAFIPNGFIADGSRGDYELSIPDAVCALAAGVTWAIVRLYGVTAMLDVKIEIELDRVNYQDGVRFGLTALPNAAANASGGLPSIGAGAGQFTPSDIAAMALKVNAWDLLEITGGTVNDVAPLASGFIGSAGLSATNSFYVGRLVCFIAGPLAGLKQPVTGYVGATRTFAFSTPFPAAPANGNAFVII
jgi:hypothetical protein